MQSIGSQLSLFTARVPLDFGRCCRFCKNEMLNADSRVSSNDECIEEFYLELPGITQQAGVSQLNLDEVIMQAHFKFCSA